ncbi:MAG: peptidyl-prolyl cis-trans isomerase [Acidobacteriota bacterium]|jgi:cyclophilin family peptidyl-prolyl cis-trans isomerase
MRPSPGLSSVLVVACIVSGWIPGLSGSVNRLRASPSRVPGAQLPGSQSGGPAGSTKAVQAPPLQAPPLEPAPGNQVATIATSLGDITIELFNDKAPVSVENFVQYARDGFYTDTIFHRVKPGFMIQGGGFTPSFSEKPTRPPIQNEATNGLRNTRGTVAMARMAALRSATAQFYINVADNHRLDHTGYSPDEFGYAVFGRVLAGMDVVDRIAAVPTHSTDSMDDVPVQPVIIKSVQVRP